MSNHHTITITKRVKRKQHADNIEFTETVFLVEAALSNGFTMQPQRCDSEEQARVYARGLQDGFNLTLNAIGNGLRYDATIISEDA